MFKHSGCPHSAKNHKIKEQHIESMKIAVEQADRAIHPDKWKSLLNSVKKMSESKFDSYT